MGENEQRLKREAHITKINWILYWEGHGGTNVLATKVDAERSKKSKRNI